MQAQKIWKIISKPNIKHDDQANSLTENTSEVKCYTIKLARIEHIQICALLNFLIEILYLTKC